MLEELVNSVDALSRDQLHNVASQLGISGLQVPIFLPGARRWDQGVS